LNERFSVVVPTIGRPSLHRLLRSLDAAEGPPPEEIVVVVDGGEVPTGLGGRVRILRGGGTGPAAARNLGWRSVDNDWIAFLDDDVEVTPDWLACLAEDLAAAAPDVAGVQGRIHVPLPADRPATDWERNVEGLQRARWATADLAYRRAALERVGGFDERFSRAYREDADVGMRMVAAGWRITTGQRAIVHPVRPADPWVSVRLQAGNADDAWMRTLHGRDWRHRAGVPRGRRPRHVAVTVAGLLAVAAALLRRQRIAALAALAWLSGTAEFAAARILPGPRTAGEIGAMLLTSAVIPPVATWHWLRGWAAVAREAARPR
jgi:glycosyltransferase involved in cell wall biosynthesis